MTDTTHKPPPIERHAVTQIVTVDDTSNPPMWYAWPTNCPMLAAKIAAGEPRRMACQGGSIDSKGNRHYFTCCWHTALGSVFHADTPDGPTVVPCCYNPETDFWNKPMGRVDPDWYQPQELGPLQ